MRSSQSRGLAGEEREKEKFIDNEIVLPCSTESMDLTKAISWPLLLCDSSSESEKLSYWAL
jgi:hypothetical protein